LPGGDRSFVVVVLVLVLVLGFAFRFEGRPLHCFDKAGKDEGDDEDG
jgi:hypothetical protein